MLVFLDLDGVLRSDRYALFELEPPLRDRFQDCMRCLPNAAIVISSGWRVGFTLDEIRGHFAVDLRSRIVGVTPIITTPRPHPRHDEVLRFVKSHGPGRPWIALDDQAEHYPVRPNVRILDSTVGFDEQAAEWMLAMGRRYGGA